MSMEAFLPFLLSIVILFGSFFILLVFQKRKKSQLNLPPGTTGWPIVGETIQMGASGPENFVQNRMKKYSEEVFRTSLLGEKMAVFCGPSGNKFVFTNQNNFLTTWWPATFLKPLTFPDSADRSLKDVTVKNRGFIQEILKPESLKDYISIMDSVSREQIETEWAPFQEVKVYPLSKKYTFFLNCRVFLGLDDPKIVKPLCESFNFTASRMFTVPVDLPGTPYSQSMKVGNMVKHEFVKIIKERKEQLSENRIAPGPGDVDFLTRMLLRTDEHARLMNEKDISNLMISLLLASYDTTSASLTFVLSYLADLPHIYNKVYKEFIEIARFKGPEELLNWDDIQKMKYSWNVACEVLRLTPPSQGTFREVVNDFTYAGFTIPKGWKTFWCVYTTHKNPKYFSDPEKFDPSRFEGSGPAPYTFVPFGGGSRMCPGREYARLEILVFMYNVVTRFKLEKLIQDEKVMYQASPFPKDGLPVRLVPHSK